MEDAGGALREMAVHSKGLVQLQGDGPMRMWSPPRYCRHGTAGQTASYLLVVETTSREYVRFALQRSFRSAL